MDDHSVVREGIVAILNQQSDMLVVAQSPNGQEAIDLFHVHHPCMVLVDIRARQGDGLAAIRAIRQHSRSVRSIILTTNDGDENIYRALKAGAKAYLLKTAECKELVETVRCVNEGGTYLPPEIALQLAGRMKYQALTVREQEVLEFIAKGWSNGDIARSLFVVEGTVKAHVSRILSKLHVDDRTQALLIAIRRGLVHLR